MTLPIDFDKHPLVPAVVQDDATRDVLMVGFMNRLAFETTQATGFVHFWSRSRNQLWKKGATSGHTQEVVSMAINCEDNSLLIQVIQNGAVCHTGHVTCYYRQILPDGSLFETSDPVFDPANVYKPKDPDALARANRKERHRREGTGFIDAWYGAYEYLASQPLQDQSGTSKLLHEHVWPFDRIADELDELAGTLAGEHGHSGNREQDVMLEGSQVFYWLTLLAIDLALEWDRDLRLDRVLFPIVGAADLFDSSIQKLREAAATWRKADTRFEEEQSDYMEEMMHELAASYALVSSAVATVAEPSRLLESDLEALRSKPYLAGYFASLGD